MQLNKLVLLLSLAAPSPAVQSIILTSGNTGTFTVPSSAPFTTLGPQRVEMRFHDWSAANAILLENSWVRVQLTSDSEICAIGKLDTAPSYGATQCANITGVSDVTISAQRDTAGLLFRMEVWATNGSGAVPVYCGTIAVGSQGNLFPCPLGSIGNGSSGGAGVIGGTNTVARIAWIGWRDGVIAAGSSQPVEYVAADLGWWKFEGNGTDSGPHGMTITHSLSYATSPSVAPVAVPRLSGSTTLRTIRAGHAAVLDATASYTLTDAAPVAYAWQQLSGANTLSWSSRSSATPTISGAIFSSYVLQLAVYDNTGAVGTATVKIGAVATDSNGVVVYPDDRLYTLIGHQMRNGTNPWAYMDDRLNHMFSYIYDQFDPFYPAWWDSGAPGLVDVTVGSNQLTCASGQTCNFTTTVCQGPGSPTVPKVNAVLALWATTGGGRRRIYAPSSCTSDTVLTLDRIYDSDLTTETGIGWAVDTTYHSNWVLGSANFGYYELGLGSYSRYHATGLDDYLTQFRAMTDRSWRQPNVDQGTVCVLEGPAGGFCQAAPRLHHMSDYVIRAIVDGQCGMLPGLRNLWTRLRWYLNTFNPGQGEILDLREQGYQNRYIAECALYDPDSDNAALCRTALKNTLSSVWQAFKTQNGSKWLSFYTSAVNSWDTSSSVALTAGVNTVTLAGDTWTSGEINGRPVWFTNSASPRPTSTAGGDSTIYTLTYVSPTTATLDRNYEGSSGTHGYVVGAAAFNDTVGWAAQPFIMGMLVDAFDLSAKALAATDPTESAAYAGLRQEATEWVRDLGYWSLTKGMYYLSGGPGCPSDTRPTCTGGNDAESARVLTAETLRGISAQQIAAPISGLNTIVDGWVGAMYSKPGFATISPPGDGSYITGLDTNGGFFPANFFVLLIKWPGTFGGKGGSQNWAAARLGGVAAADNRTYTQSCDLAGIQVTYSTVARLRIVLTAPNRATAETICSSGEASIIVDRRMAGGGGKYKREMFYETTGGAAIVTRSVGSVTVD